jgi:hypothetical protein
MRTQKIATQNNKAQKLPELKQNRENVEPFPVKSGIIVTGTMINDSSLKAFIQYFCTLLLTTVTWTADLDIIVKIITAIAAILASLGAFIHYLRLAQLNKLKADAIRKAIEKGEPIHDDED